MILRHYTTRENAVSIHHNGLDPAKSRGKEKCVWLVDEFAAWRLVRHLEASRGAPPDGWAVLLVNVPDEWLVRTPVMGRWKCYHHIPAGHCRYFPLERQYRTARRKDGGPRRPPSPRRRGRKARHVS